MEASPTYVLGLFVILWKYKVVVKEMPIRHPPRKDMEHFIELDPTKDPTVVCHYRYEHFQKSKIKRLMEEPFRSWDHYSQQESLCYPSCLGKGKNGSYCLCIDYKAFNRITIKNKFRMPHINDLMVELHSAQFFIDDSLIDNSQQVLVDLYDVSTHFDAMSVIDEDLIDNSSKSILQMFLHLYLC